jgi:hypothetical protein
MAIVYWGTGLAIGNFEVTEMQVDPGTVPNFPNPFDPQVEVTNIAIELASPTTVGIYIYDITAKQVWKRVVSLPAGINVVQWNGYTYFGKMADNGVYLLRVADESSKEFIGKGKVLVIKR